MQRITSTAEDVSVLLRSEHREIEQLIADVRTTRGAARTVAFTALRRLLATHEAAEEAFIHSLEPGAVAQAQHREEVEFREVICRLEAIDPDTSAFDDAFAKFADSLAAHVRAQEHRELPQLTKDASPEELGRLYSALQFVPEPAGQPSGPIDRDARFASMLARAKALFSAVSVQAG